MKCKDCKYELTELELKSEFNDICAECFDCYDNVEEYLDSLTDESEVS